MNLTQIKEFNSNLSSDKFRHILIDGNNLLISNEKMNDIQLENSNKAEKLLTLIISQFAIKFQELKESLEEVRYITIVFESIKPKACVKLGEIELNISSVKPKFKSIFEVYLNEVEKLVNNEKDAQEQNVKDEDSKLDILKSIPKSLIVTSDENVLNKIREMRDNKFNGSLFMNSNNFFYILQKFI